MATPYGAIISTAPRPPPRARGAPGGNQHPPERVVHGVAFEREGRKTQVAEHGHLEEPGPAEVRHGIRPPRGGPVVPELPENSTDRPGGQEGGQLRRVAPA